MSEAIVSYLPAGEYVLTIEGRSFIVGSTLDDMSFAKQVAFRWNQVEELYKAVRKPND